ncbi:MAG: hypothetical protein Q7T11_09095 [Deltaproteobacteria bacterium]|nr:hypothetical protein [Deltaproteobacteria bacterium]
MTPFQIEYYSRAKRDLEKLSDSREAVLIIDAVSETLSENPFPKPPIKKRIQGISYPLFRLRVDTARDSYRVFYIFREKIVTILRIVKKKDADKVIRALR